jgi:hypothetical protein
VELCILRLRPLVAYYGSAVKQSGTAPHCMAPRVVDLLLRWILVALVVCDAMGGVTVTVRQPGDGSPSLLQALANPAVTTVVLGSDYNLKDDPLLSTKRPVGSGPVQLTRCVCAAACLLACLLACKLGGVGRSLVRTACA